LLRFELERSISCQNIKELVQKNIQVFPAKISDEKLSGEEYF
jgi:hypothetical protein